MDVYITLVTAGDWHLEEAKGELRPTAETFSDIVWRYSRLPASSLKE